MKGDKVGGRLRLDFLDWGVKLGVIVVTITVNGIVNAADSIVIGIAIVIDDLYHIINQII